MTRKFFLAFILSLTTAGMAPAQERAIEASFAAATVAERDGLLAQVEKDADTDASAAMALAAHTAFGALEAFSQSLHRHGFRTPQTMMMPLMRLPLPENPAAKPLTYEQWREILEALDTGLGKAIEILEDLPGDADAAFVVDLRALRFDLNSDGALDEGESVGAILAALANPMQRRQRNAGQAEDGVPPPVFRFDRADAFWLQGYANFLRANTKMWLAHDFRETFDLSFQLFFPGSGMQVDSPAADKVSNLMERMVRAQTEEEREQLRKEYEALPEEEKQKLSRSAGVRGAANWDSIFDLVSFIHTINWQVADEDARADVRRHVLEMIRLSRLNWQAIAAETDNDREWLPGPHQPGRHPLTQLTITDDTVTAWHGTLELMETALNGEVLVPHPRFPGHGVNLRRFFDEPSRFDLVLTISGPGVLPYLETGTVLDEKVWNGATRAFGRGNFFAYAVWIN